MNFSGSVYIGWRYLRRHKRKAFLLTSAITLSLFLPLGISLVVREAENHLRWDSLGEFLALTVSLEDIAAKTGNKRAKVLADALDAATAKLLENNKSPSRKTHEPDNRASHYYLGMYWAEALALQDDDAALKAEFAPLAQALADHEELILRELVEIQGEPVDIGGYYHPDPEKADAAMRPSQTLNRILAG